MGISFNRGAQDSTGDGKVRRKPVMGFQNDGLGRQNTMFAPKTPLTNPEQAVNNSVDLGIAWTYLSVNYYSYTTAGTPPSTITMNIDVASNRWVDLVGLRFKGTLNSIVANGSVFNPSELFGRFGVSGPFYFVHNTLDIAQYGLSMTVNFVDTTGAGGGMGLIMPETIVNANQSIVLPKYYEGQSIHTLFSVKE